MIANCVTLLIKQPGCQEDTGAYQKGQLFDMTANPRAGQPAQPEDLIDVAHLVTDYYTVLPDPDDINQQVAFGKIGRASCRERVLTDV